MALLASPWARQLLRRLLSIETAESRSERFLKLIATVRPGISEVSPLAAADAVAKGAVLIDVRERRDYLRSHPAGAINISRGCLELEVDKFISHDDQDILCICGEGSRSVLAVETLLRMGFRSVYSVEGGFRAWVEAGLPARTNHHLIEE